MSANDDVTRRTAVGVGGVVLSLVDGGRTPYRALDAGRYEDVGQWGVLGLTLAVIVVQP